MQCIQCIVYSVSYVLWIDAAHSWSLAWSDIVAEQVSVIVGGQMEGSGIDAMACDTRTSVGGCVGRFSSILKYICHLSALDPVR